MNRYPQAELEQLWKQLLFNQFHDILPGSSIKEVYDQTDQEYRQLFDKGCELIHALLPETQAPKATSWHVFNPLGQARTGLVYLDDQTGVKKLTRLSGPMMTSFSQNSHYGWLELQNIDPCLSCASIKASGNAAGGII